MALQKTVSARGSSASYFRVVAYRWDANTREASAIFSLYRDKAHSDRSKPGAQNREAPVFDIGAKLRLNGPRFDKYLSAAALSATDNDVLGQFYVAAKAEPVISDFGPDLFAAAENA